MVKIHTRYAGPLLLSAVLAAGCTGSEDATTTAAATVAPSTTTPPTTAAPTTTTTSTTTSTTTTTTATTTTTTTTTTTLPPEPTTSEEFDEIYRSLDAIRGEARRNGDLERMAEAVTATSDSYENLQTHVEAGNTLQFPDDPTTYTIESVELYDKPSEERAQLIVHDTWTGEIVVVDEGGAEVETISREIPQQIFLVTLQRTNEGWRIASDQNITDTEGDGTTSFLALEPEPDDLLSGEESDRDGLAYTSTFWKVGDDGLCLHIRIDEPALGRVARCVDPLAEPGSLDLYVLPFEDVDGTLYTAYFLVTPGGEMDRVEWDRVGEDAEFDDAFRITIDFEMTGSWAVFEGEPTAFRMLDENFNVIFESEV